MAREFVDTNIMIYAFSSNAKTSIAEAILIRGCETSVQGLNEFVSVARRKMAMNWREIENALKTIRILCSAIHPLDIEMHEEAVKLAERYGFAIFDALLIAAALRANCTVFHSEDMHHGMLVENQLRISNPFRMTS